MKLLIIVNNTTQPTADLAFLNRFFLAVKSFFDFLPTSTRNAKLATEMLKSQSMA